MSNKKNRKFKDIEDSPIVSATDIKKLDTDAAETQIAEQNVSNSFPIVGIGASAGGLAAFESFFSGMPADRDPGMAFVIVQHLAPDHKSILTELIRHYTHMQVFEVEDGMAVKPNCVYIIPPNCDIALIKCSLQLLQPSAPRGQRLPIDFFFRSLAQDQQDRAICIILSGTGSDGTLGLRMIKGMGGMAMAQSPDSTEYDGMPSSAIATGLVDYELKPEEMPSQLIAYVTHAFGSPLRVSSTPTNKAENALTKILLLLRMQTGHDFSQYKTSTIHRRIARRMAVQQIETIDGYAKFLRESPAEANALFQDMLIGVTNFFRDPEAFKALEEQVIPKLFLGKPAGSAIRVWSSGCSTGEEAYSIAILLQEHMETLKRRYEIQVFATDIDSQAIAVARAGCYPASIALDISPERLARFFTFESDGKTYRIHKSIRDTLIFSEQDVIKDPPFSKLDIISCRNVLIYMNMNLQKKLIPLFHYALNPGGVLFMGTSESVGMFDDMFATINTNAKLFKRIDGYQKTQRIAISQLFQPQMPAESTVKFQSAAAQIEPSTKRSLREITEYALLKHVNIAGILVNKHADILYIHGHTGMYLEPAQGETNLNNILKMAREGLQYELASALHKAALTKEPVRYPGLRIKVNDMFNNVNLTILPLVTNSLEPNDSDIYLVVLEEAVEGKSSIFLNIEGSEQTNVDERVAALQRELSNKDEYLQSISEQLESMNEELRSSNEEMQSVNEELQSTNEELETSKEELQSINEELTTVNIELQTKVADLSQANNDLSNLLASTGIGTIFVNHQQRVKRFTPSAANIMNLIMSDIGRPLAHVTSNLASYKQIREDIQEVLDTLIPKELEVQTTNSKWYSMRIQPYRTIDNVIEGAVLTFVDISETVKAREVLKMVNEVLRLAVVVRDSRDAITVQGLDGHILAWNPSACRMYGWSEAEALLMNICELIPKDRNKKELIILQELIQNQTLEPYRTQRTAKNGTIIEIMLTATALIDETEQVYAIATTERAVDNTP